jgi:hypothetical protein
MNLKTLLAAAQAQILWADPSHESADALHVVAADLMSDVLTMDLERPLLLTSLATEQAVRTAHVVGAVAVLVANGKTPPPEMVALAHKLGLPLARTALPKFDAAVALGKALGC